MLRYESAQNELKKNPKTWLITGVAGFIGSNILAKLLELNQKVVGIDNFSTGFKSNLDEVKSEISDLNWKNLSLIEGDIRDLEFCKNYIKGVDFILHQAALGSIPRSIKDPTETNSNNISGFLNILEAAKCNNIKKIIFASSSSVYGDIKNNLKIEKVIGKQLNPYALSKYVNELYAEIFSNNYGLECTGLRYFNVFGKRQSPYVEYSAVIPKWISSIMNGSDVYIFGDGETSRDFCYVDNVVQANILAAIANNNGNIFNIFNIAVGYKTSLNQLYKLISDEIKAIKKDIKINIPVYKDFRPGDIKHSLADISLAEKIIGYTPIIKIENGIKLILPWYQNILSKKT